MIFVDLNLFIWQELSPGNNSEDDKDSCLFGVLIAFYCEVLVRTSVRQTSRFFLWEGLLFLYRISMNPLSNFCIL